MGLRTPACDSRHGAAAGAAPAPRVTGCRYLLGPIFGTIKGMTPSAAAVNGTAMNSTATNGTSPGGLDAGHPLMDGRTADSPLITAYRGTPEIVLHDARSWYVPK